jgi:hypothetical protein
MSTLPGKPAYRPEFNKVKGAHRICGTIINHFIYLHVSGYFIKGLTKFNERAMHQYGHGRMMCETSTHIYGPYDYMAGR